MHITVLLKGNEEKGGGGVREIQILKVDNIVVCAGQDPKNNMQITARGGRRERYTGSRR